MHTYFRLFSFIFCLQITLFSTCLIYSQVQSYKSEKKDPIQTEYINGTWDNIKKQITVKVKINIPSPWHIYSDSLVQDYLTPLDLKLDLKLLDSLKGKVVFSKFPNPKKINILNEEIEVFSDTLSFEKVFKINSIKNLKINKDNSLIFNMLLQYQACSDDMCLAPQFKKYLLMYANGSVVIKSI